VSKHWSGVEVRVLAPDKDIVNHEIGGKRTPRSGAKGKDRKTDLIEAKLRSNARKLYRLRPGS